MHIAAATKTAPPASIEELASIGPAPTATNDEATPGAHFAGLVKPVVAAIVPKASIESVDDDSEDEENEDGARLRGFADRAALRAITSKRLLAARLMNGYAQGEAAELLKQGTSAQLSQCEQGRRQAPLYVMLRASEVYRVSMDYLCGVSADPERDVRAARRNATERAVRATLVGAVERVVAAMDSGEGVVGPNVATLRELVSAADAVAATYGDFVQQRNVARIADRLAVAIEALEAASLRAGISLRRREDEDARARQRLAEIAANDAD